MGRHLMPRGGGGLRLAARAVVVAGLLAGPGVADAHTKLVRTAASGQGVALTFSTPASPRLTRIDVLAAAGEELDPGEPRNAPGDPATVLLPLRGGLRRGRYFVTWSTANDDGHVVNGVFDFNVLGAPAPGARRYRMAPVAPGAPDAVQGALSVARITQDAALTLALGLVVFFMVVWRRMTAVRARSPGEHDGLAGELIGAGRVTAVRARSPGEHGAPAAPVDVAVTARLRTLLVAAAAVGAASAVGALALQAAIMARTAPRDGAAVAAMGDLLTARAGTCWAVAALQWSAAIVAARRRPDGALVAGIAALLVLSAPLRGHGGDGALGLAVVVHVAAAGAWIGGLVAMLAAARAARCLLSLRERPPLLAAVVSRFAVIALPCAVLVLATGVLQAVALLDGPEQLLTTTYGRLVAVKLVLFAAILGLAARARRAFVARLWKADGARAAVAMRKTLAMELALAMTALTAAGAMASTGPPA